MPLPSSFLQNLIQDTETVQRNRQAGRYAVDAIQTTVHTISLEHFLLRPRQCRRFLSRLPPFGGRLLKIRDPLGNHFTLISLPRDKIIRGLLQVRSVPNHVCWPHQRMFLAQHIINVCTISASLIHQILGAPIEWRLTAPHTYRSLSQCQVDIILGFCPKPPNQDLLKSHCQAPQVILAA